MSEELADVIVVGAGPAGATTACWLADQGLSVALLSSTFPFLLDIFAMRRLPASLFGVLLSASPAVASDRRSTKASASSDGTSTSKVASKRKSDDCTRPLASARKCWKSET
mgnify:CR=1 FL=1